MKSAAENTELPFAASYTHLLLKDASLKLFIRTQVLLEFTSADSSPVGVPFFFSFSFWTIASESQFFFLVIFLLLCKTLNSGCSLRDQALPGERIPSDSETFPYGASLLDRQHKSSLKQGWAAVQTCKSMMSSAPDDIIAQAGIISLSRTLEVV